MDIKDLPQAGSRFRIGSGSGSFSQKLSSASRSGTLKSLTNNKDAVIKALKHHEGAIRQGDFNSYRQRKALNVVKQSNKDLSKEEIREIKTAFKHISEGEPEKKPKVNKELDKDLSFEDDKNKKIKASISRFNRTRGGGESTLKFTSTPGKTDRTGREKDKDKMSFSGKLLEKRFLKREKSFEDRLPRERIKWEDERGKRLEVASLGGEIKNTVSDEKVDSKQEKKKSEAYRPFQNL